MRTGRELLELSSENPEPIVDSYYEKTWMAISNSPDEPNDLMVANQELLRHVTAYSVASEHENSRMMSDCVSTIMSVLGTPGANYTEFVSFWVVMDVTYSMYNRLSEPEQRQFLSEVIPQYIRKRHSLFLRHGYSSTTLQVQADSFAHKRTGPFGRAKIDSLFREYGLERIDTWRPGMDGVYVFPDGGDQVPFRSMLEHYGATFDWSQGHDGKLPDAALMWDGHLIIIEHKHIKEVGGGQDKQLVEIADFVSGAENSQAVSYVAFLDGMLFNKIFCGPVRKNKMAEQRRRIYDALDRVPSNYFVNTAGFVALLGDIENSLA